VELVVAGSNPVGHPIFFARLDCRATNHHNQRVNKGASARLGR
jgi:hypothetical protein